MQRRRKGKPHPPQTETERQRSCIVAQCEVRKGQEDKVVQSEVDQKRYSIVVQNSLKRQWNKKIMHFAQGEDEQDRKVKR